MKGCERAPREEVTRFAHAPRGEVHVAHARADTVAIAWSKDRTDILGSCNQDPRRELYKDASPRHGRLHMIGAPHVARIATTAARVAVGFIDRVARYVLVAHREGERP